MKRLTLGALTILLLAACPVSAALVVDAGDWILKPNTAGQEIQVTIFNQDPTSIDQVMSAVVAAEMVGNSPLPSFAGGSIIDGTIFALNNEGEDANVFYNQLALLSTITDTGMVGASGILAKLVVSTMGVATGDFTLILRDTSWGNTEVIPDPEGGVKYIDGTIHIDAGSSAVPEPATLAIWSLFGAVGMTSGWLRRRKTV